MVQVFAQTGQPTAETQGSWDDEDMNGYQLLNEVGSGGTLSSLFTILSLFTEDVKMSWQDDHVETASSQGSPETDDGITMPLNARANSDVSHLDLGPGPQGRSRRSSVSSTTSTVHGGETTTSPGRRIPRSVFSPTPEEDTPLNSNFVHVHRDDPVRPPTSVHRGVVARATEDTTLAVIPAEAFRRLTKKFPKATGHIVQGQPHDHPLVLTQ